MKLPSGTSRVARQCSPLGSGLCCPATTGVQGLHLLERSRYVVHLEGENDPLGECFPAAHPAVTASEQLCVVVHPNHEPSRIPGVPRTPVEKAPSASGF